jgi:hypothetical protein
LHNPLKQPEIRTLSVSERLDGEGLRAKVPFAGRRLFGLS